VSIVVEPTPITIWPGGAPGTEGWTQEPQEFVGADGSKLLRNVSQPVIYPYLPDPATATGTAVVVCPGGGHTVLAYEHEGTGVAEWLVERGVAAFVLHYRVRPSPTDDAEHERKLRADMAGPNFREMIRDVERFAIEDGKQAIRIVRGRAREWGVDPDRIGIMGFSAGGHLAMGVAFDHDAESRPAFVAPIYPAWPKGAVPEGAPPVFLACAADDQMAVQSSLPIFSQWREAGHSVELHIFSKGGHGFGMRKQGLPSDHWIELFGNWLLGQGLIPKQA
jgi:acetyl esterase/lipase